MTGSDLSTDSTIRKLEEMEPLREPLLRAALESLHLPRGSAGLDVGCGIGLQAVILAEEVGPDGRITGLDLSPQLLGYAETVVKRFHVEPRVSFRQGDMYHLPFEENTFDWVWSADCAGYPAGELLPVLKEMQRVTRPGGSIAISGWTSQSLLPGYPLLEARLNATCSAYAPYLSGKPPEAHFLRALGWFRQAGLQETGSKTFVRDIQAPLSHDLKRALTSLFDMLWGEPLPEVASADWQDFQRLCQAGSPDSILDLPDYCAFFTCTLFYGRVSK